MLFRTMSPSVPQGNKKRRMLELEHAPSWALPPAATVSGADDAATGRAGYDEASIEDRDVWISPLWMHSGAIALLATDTLVETRRQR